MKKFLLYAGAIIFVVVLAWVSFFKNSNTKEETLVIHPNDFLRQVSVSGKVTATQNVDVSFEQGGRVTNVRVKVGDRVSAGQLLASQDTAQLDAQLAEMQAGIDVQKAKLGQLLAGASLEDTQVAQTAVVNAQTAVDNAQQSVSDARQNLIDKLQDAYTKADDAARSKADQLFDNPTGPSPKLSLGGFVDTQLTSDIEWERLMLGATFKSWAAELTDVSAANDLSGATTLAKKNLNDAKSFLDNVSLALNGLTQNLNVAQATIDKWKADIATARANVNTAVANLTSAQTNLKTTDAALSTTQGNLKTAQDQLALKKAPVRSSDVVLYEAQIKQAQASAQDVVAQLAKKQTRSPINAVVTSVNAKVGGVIGANETAVSLISNNTLQIESYIPEIKIPFVKVGDQAAVTLDAYGSEEPFGAQVLSIDPAETVRDGISTYRVKLQFLNSDERIKPGMTANILITTEKKPNTIAIPQGIVINRDGKKFVETKEGDNVIERQVQTGGVSSLGQIEIISGLKDGDVVLLNSAK